MDAILQAVDEIEAAEDDPNDGRICKRHTAKRKNVLFSTIIRKMRVEEQQRHIVEERGENEAETSEQVEQVDGDEQLNFSGPNPGGAQLRQLLPSFDKHVAYKVWYGKERKQPVKIHNHVHKLKEWDLSKECNYVQKKVKSSGLAHLANISYDNIDRVLVNGFLERWDGDTSSFHLPFGEMSITFEDLVHILHLPVHGKSMKGSFSSRNLTIDKAKELMLDAFGVADEKADKMFKDNKSVTLDWIKGHCKGSQEVDDIEKKKRTVRGYLLYLMGCTLLCDKSGNKVGVYHLQCLRDVDKLGEISWGTGILANLYREMGLASVYKQKQMGGYMSLLQAWIHEHFNLGRSIPQKGYNNSRPRLQKWADYPIKMPTEDGVVALREQLDDLDARFVIWDPYTAKRGTNPIEEISFYNGPIVYHDTTESYNPKRVLRQLGRIQTIPSQSFRYSSTSSNSSSSWFWDNNADHRLAIENRSIPVERPWDCIRGYMEWYKIHSNVFVQNPRRRRTRPPPDTWIGSDDYYIEGVTRALEALKLKDVSMCEHVLEKLKNSQPLMAEHGTSVVRRNRRAAHTTEQTHVDQ